MKPQPFCHVAVAACCSALCFTNTAVHAQAVRSGNVVDDVSVDTLKRDVTDLARQLDTLKRELEEEKSKLRDLRRSVRNEYLASQRGGTAQPSSTSQQGPQGQGGTQVAMVSNPTAQDGTPATEPVGVAPERNSRQREVAPIFEQPGILTPKGKFALEPSIQYSYSSNNRVALVGYTVIPALLIGLVDVRQVKSNTVTGALTGRYGLTNRTELELRVPYVYRSDSTVSREIFTGSATDNVFQTSGKAIGDVEASLRYQFNDGGADRPYFIGTMRVKSRTGKDPFEVVTDCVTRCVGNTTGTGLPMELPTGSGAYSLQPGLTWLFPSDPAVFFGSFSYQYNFKRNNVSRRVLNGESEFLGDIKAGDILGANFGMGLALNDKSSFSVGFDLNSVGRTKQNDVTVPGSVRTVLASLLLGYSYRYSDKTSFSMSIGAGLTRDTPDLTLTMRVPMSF
ncbi:acetate kinase [Undibacterium sp. TJN25]|uniref:acetate kinase n=1 Tax=Undibacterium sp. TJN25 TaxID=3413056 RepID=UPI003BF01748